MLPIVEDQLRTTETHEMFLMYSRMFDMFDAFDVEDYQLAYEDLMISADGAFDGVSVFDNHALYNLTMLFAKQILLEHQIGLSDSATMNHYIQVLEFIKDIEKTELLELCHDALVDETTDNIDKFANCLEIVSSIPVSSSMEFLGSIPDCVISTVADYFQRRIDLEVAKDAIDSSVKDVYKELDKFARLIEGQSMRCYQYLMVEDGCVGLPFTHHFKLNEEYLLALPLQAMLYELVGFALISENGLSNPEQTIISSLGEYIEDLDRLTVIQYELSKVLIEYRNEIGSGIGFIQ